jgi:hypothetical protein
MSVFESEASFEQYVRSLIARINEKNLSVHALESKKAVDIVICRDLPSPAAFFLEIKYYQRSKGRCGVGDGQGRGFQPELLDKKPGFFEKNLRWVLGSDCHEGNGLWFVTSDTIRKYIAGGNLGKKHNNIQEALFREMPSVSEDQFVTILEEWLHHDVNAVR